MTILISGANGYLGNRLAKMFGQAGHQVQALSRHAQKLPVADAVVHTACCYGRAGEIRSEIFASNAEWPLRILEMVRPGTLFLNADTVIPASVNDYAASKEWFREKGRERAKARSVRWLNLRLENFYGPGEGADKFITQTVRGCLKGDELRFTRGNQQREFIFIDDVAGAFDVAFRVAADDRDIVDVRAGTGAPIRIRELVERIDRLCGSRGSLRFGALPCREDEPTDIGPENVDPISRYGWRAVVGLDEGLDQVVRFEKAREEYPCVCS